MDLDVGEVDLHVLREKVRGVIDSRPFAQILEARGMRIEHVTEAKQTSTTQRWKFGLRTDGSDIPLPTKIEFSNRGLDEGVEFGSVDAEVVRFHQLPPMMASHYGAPAAFLQKVGALAHRRETQARDVFDLHHLIAIGAGAEAFREVGRRVAEQARYDSASVWESTVLEVMEALGGGKA